VAKQVLQLGMGDAFDDWLIEKIQRLRRGSVVAAGIQRVEQVLFKCPFVYFSRKRGANDNSICMWNSNVFGSLDKCRLLLTYFCSRNSCVFLFFSDCALCSFSPFRGWRQGTGVCTVISHHLTCFIDISCTSIQMKELVHASLKSF